MQGSAADLIKSAMIVVQGWLDAERLRTPPADAGA
jgi:DNA polymerase I-like protein with 3'-5' exonuclease and polymerase domains